MSDDQNTVEGGSAAMPPVVERTANQVETYLARGLDAAGRGDDEMEALFRAAGVPVGMAALVSDPQMEVLTKADTDVLVSDEDRQRGLNAFSHMVAPDEPEIEIEDIGSLDLEEVISLLRDRAVTGRSRSLLHKRLDVLVLS